MALLNSDRAPRGTNRAPELALIRRSHRVVFSNVGSLAYERVENFGGGTGSLESYLRSEAGQP